MSNIWTNRKVLSPKVKVLIFYMCSVPNQFHVEVTLNFEKQFSEAEGVSKNIACGD